MTSYRAHDAPAPRAPRHQANSATKAINKLDKKTEQPIDVDENPEPANKRDKKTLADATKKDKTTPVAVKTTVEKSNEHHKKGEDVSKKKAEEDVAKRKSEYNAKAVEKGKKEVKAKRQDELTKLRTRRLLILTQGRVHFKKDREDLGKVAKLIQFNPLY